MKLNSTAVMQRRVEGKESLDDFPTPPWATRALCEFLLERRLLDLRQSIREPAANRGYMARTLQEYVVNLVQASDIEDYGVGYPVKDYLTAELPIVDWTITNPPFVKGVEFIEKALETSHNVAVILRTAFLEGKGRYERLFSVKPPQHVLQFVERVPMVKGRYDPKASSATAYAWFVWSEIALNEMTELVWIPPCKEKMVKPDKDYI